MEAHREYPIKLVVTTNNSVCGGGFTVVYKTERGCESFTVWTSLGWGARCDGVQDEMDKLRFTREGENHVVGRMKTITSGIFFKKTREEFVVEEIVLREGTVSADGASAASAA
jgi:hypothetical protein